MTTDHIDFDIEKLSKYLQVQVADFKPIESIEKFSGWAIKPDLSVRYSGRYICVAQAAVRQSLLKSAHQVDREFRVMRGNSLPDTPLPTMVHLCRDADVIGAMFFVMSFIDGDQFVDPRFPTLDTSQRADYYWAAVDTLASIHNADLQTTGLHDFGKGVNFF